ncbi:MAG: TolC family protein [Gemmatimonadota bacterium]|nr:TolC family protein [Gemmatimonadota bacterium]
MRGNFITNLLQPKARLCAAMPAIMLLVAAPVYSSGSPDTLKVSLDRMISYALKSSPRILAAESGVLEARGMKVASLAGNLPHVSVSEVFSRGNDPVFAFGSKLRQAGFRAMDFDLPRLNEPGPITNYATRVVVEQPIFSGGQSYYNRKVADAVLTAARRSADFTREQTVFDVRRSYYSSILARESLAVIDAAQAAASSHKHQAAQRLSAGMATRADELKAAVRVSELEQQRIRAENAVTVAVEYLKLAAGWREDKDKFLYPAEKLAAPGFNTGLDSLVAFALARHGSLAAAGSAAEAAGFAARAAVGEVIPHLNAFFQYQSDSRRAFGSDGDNWMVGVVADWKLFSGFGSIGKIKSSQARREKARYELSLMRHKVEVEVREAYLDTRAAARRIEVAGQATEQAGESLRILENQYREGLATITDLLDTELAATNSRLSYVQALYEYNLALARVSLVTGGFPIPAQVK